MVEALEVYLSPKIVRFVRATKKKKDLQKSLEVLGLADLFALLKKRRSNL